MGRLTNSDALPGNTPKPVTQAFGEPANALSDIGGAAQPPTRRRLIPIWVWLMLPFVVMLLGGWWIYQSLVVRNLSFDTRTTVTTGASVVEAVKQVNDLNAQIGTSEDLARITESKSKEEAAKLAVPPDEVRTVYPHDGAYLFRSLPQQKARLFCVVLGTKRRRGRE